MIWKEETVFHTRGNAFDAARPMNLGRRLDPHGTKRAIVANSRVTLGLSAPASRAKSYTNILSKQVPKNKTIEKGTIQSRLLPPQGSNRTPRKEATRHQDKDRTSRPGSSDPARDRSHNRPSLDFSDRNRPLRDSSNRINHVICQNIKPLYILSWL